MGHVDQGACAVHVMRTADYIWKEKPNSLDVSCLHIIPLIHSYFQDYLPSRNLDPLSHLFAWSFTQSVLSA